MTTTSHQSPHQQVWVWNNVVDELKPILLMTIVQIAFAGVNVFYKISVNHGMNLRILIAYRLLFAAAFLSPLAFFLERKTRPKLTWTVLGQAFLCGLFGGALSQNLYLESLVLTSATFAAAMGNLVPGITFILAASFGLEKLGIRTGAGKAKILGTLIGISGAMVLTLYKGVEIHLWSTNIHLLKQSNNVHHQGHMAAHDGRDRVLGALLSVGASLSYAAWLIIQSKMSKRYPSHYSSTALMSLMGSLQSVAFALCLERDWKQWRLGWDIRLLTVAYAGIICSGMMVALIAWCVHMKGPLFVSIFSPLMLIAVALAGSLILDEKLHLGSVIGGLLIVLGLYGVIWGKEKEIKMMDKLVPLMSHNNGSNEVMEIISSTDEEKRKSNKDNVIKSSSNGGNVPTENH